MTKFILTAIFVFSLNLFLSGQSVIWNDIPDPKIPTQQIFPESYRTMTVDFESLKALLLAAPGEGTDLRNSNYIFQLPTPDGSRAGFKIVEASVMAPELQARYPNIRSYMGIGTGDYAGANISLDFTLKGFHAQILMEGKTYYIDPLSPGDLNTYIIYTRESFFKGNTKVMTGSCTPEDIGVPQPGGNTPSETSGEPVDLSLLTANGTNLRTYELALACTGEYAQFHGGTVALVMSAFTTTMTRVNGVYRSDLCLRMLMVANNDDLIFLNALTDGYTNENGSLMRFENQSKIDLEIGSSNYDIGHVFSTGGGGVATLGVVCNNGSKAQGVTGTSNPVGDPFDIDYVCHEMGHQWDADHTFNNTYASQRVSSSAFEPGSGSTIMAYAGISSPNLQSNSDAYFHNRSYTQIVNYSVTGSGNSCATITPANNTPPSITMPSGGFYIPKSTPFELTASATDPNGDLLTYCWEEYDLGPATTAGDLNLTNPSGNAPIFRSWSPTTSSTRVFPRLSDLVNNTTVVGELLPTYARDLTFRLTVRDYWINGAVNDAELSFDVANNSGPFVVTAPNTSTTWDIGSSQTVTWNVANTTASPVSCSTVNIYLSTDGGFTYPTLLVSNTSNDGSQSIVVPNLPTTQARIKVKASSNIFFDISNYNFTIGAAAPPANDAICSAITVNCGDNLAGSNANATPSSLGNPSCASGTDDDVFYKFNATAGNTYTITVNGSNYDGVLAIYSGNNCISTLTEIDCADEGTMSGVAETITYTSTEDQQIFIQTHDWFANGGEFTISLDCEFGNDDPCDAYTLTCGQSVNGSTVGATQSSLGTPSCGSGTPADVFYKINAVAGVNYTVTVNGADYDGVLAAYSGSCSSTLTELDCSDSGIGVNLSETINFSVAFNQIVYIQTHDWSNSGGSFLLEVACANIPYDDPCEARNLYCGESFSGSSAGATTSSLGTPSCATGSQNDVFFKFTALANTSYSVTVNGDTYDGVLVAYTGICSGILTEIDCSDIGFFSGIAETVNILVPTEQEILIRTYDYSAIGQSDFTITLHCPIPANDDCVDALTLSVNDAGQCPANQVEGTTYGATSSDPEACESSAPDVYYTFNSGSNSEVIINLGGITASDLVLSVFEESCSSTAFFCEIGVNQSPEISVDPFTTYYVRVHSFFANSNGTFNICVQAPYDCPLLSANIGDTCNDNDPDTNNDVVTADCNCVGTAVASGTLSGIITGWSSSCAERDVVVSIANFNTGNVYNNLPGTLHSNGSFSLDGSPEIIPGTYSVLVKVDGALAVRVDNVVISAGLNTMVVPAATLGDLNNDNAINIADISQFTSTFGSAIGDPNYDPLADFNCDGAINITDVSVISNNYGEEGDGFIL